MATDLSEAEGLDIWRRASKHPVGILLKTNNRYKLKQRLYQIRARSKEEDFSTMMLRDGNEQNELLVVHRPTATPIKPMSEDDLDGI